MSRILSLSIMAIAFVFVSGCRRPTTLLEQHAEDREVADIQIKYHRGWGPTTAPFNSSEGRAMVDSLLTE